MARYSWLLRWADGQPRHKLEFLVKRDTARFESNPDRVSNGDQQRLAAARHHLGLTPLKGLPDVTR